VSLVILDRDGVINYDSDAYIKSPDEWRPIPGSLEAIARLHQAGYKIAVATNQSGLARGYYNLQTLEDIHQKMITLVQRAGGDIDLIEYCPHGPDDHCNCRKPLPGLLQKISSSLAIDLAGVPMVGDSQRDIEAAQAAGAMPVLLRSGKLSKLDGVPENLTFDDLAAFTQWFLAR